MPLTDEDLNVKLDWLAGQFEKQKPFRSFARLLAIGFWMIEARNGSMPQPPDALKDDLKKGWPGVVTLLTSKRSAF